MPWPKFPQPFLKVDKEGKEQGNLHVRFDEGDACTNRHLYSTAKGVGES
jgi:hypothetical protein